MRRAVAAGLASIACLGLGLGACGVVVSSAGGALGSATFAGPVPGAGAGVAAGIPAVPGAWEALDQAAVAGECPGLSWAVLAAIGRVESDSGRSTLPGVASGTNAAGAEGPMQFEPATFARYAVVAPGGADPASPYDPADAVYSAARLLCADGAAGALASAVFAYDHTPVYVETVLVLATSLATDPSLGATAATALAFAAAQLGTPYRWGGTGAGGFDCSGLVQAAYRAAGVVLPRVAQAQFDAGPRLGSGAAVSPGDLVFFGASDTAVTHVGIVVGAGAMIDAPHTGAVVRVEPTPETLGAAWGAERLVGVTDPAA